jgi:DNA-binding NtrC family response regulator/ligand-binding sensor domain-containing protein
VGVGVSVVRLIPASSKWHPLRSGITFVLFFNLFFSPSQLFQAFAAAQHGDSSPQAIAQNHVEFEHLTAAHGLSNNTQQSAAQDSLGFMWFGTTTGLNRFDGYKFKVYKHEPGNPHSLSGNMIEALYVDRSGVLWVGTGGNGLNKFEPEQERFVRYLHDPDDPNSIASNTIHTILEDRLGVLWLGTSAGLCRFDREQQRFIRYQRDPEDPGSISNNQVFDILEDRAGRLWIATYGGGLNQLVSGRQTGEKPRFDRYRHSPRDPSSLGSDNLLVLCEDTEGQIWIGTWDRGLDRFHPGESAGFPSLTFKHFAHDPDTPLSLSHNQIQDIVEDRAGTLWIGTFAGGLNRFNRAEETFRRYLHNPQDRSSLSHNCVRMLFVDRSGLLWIGTGGGGINTFDCARKPFRHLSHDPLDPNSLSDTDVRSIYEDRTGALWIGTQGGGLNKLVSTSVARATSNHASGARPSFTVTRYRHNPADPGSLSNNTVWAICEDHAGNVWVATFDGLNRMDRKTGRFVRFQHDANDPHSLSENTVYRLRVDRFGQIWAGTYDGLNRFEAETGRFQRFAHDPENPGSLSADQVLPIFEDRAGGLWIGTSGGLNQLIRGAPSSAALNSHTETAYAFERYQHDPSYPYSLSDNLVWSIYEDRNGTLWIGTTTGLNKFERERKRFVRYSSKNGLTGEFVAGITEDERGNLWLSTGGGLFRFDPRCETFRHYDAADGLKGSQFPAILKRHNGEILVGGDQGLNAFFPEELEDNPYVPPVVITDFQLSNRPVAIKEGSVLQQSILATRELALSHNDRVVSFEFAALNYRHPEKSRYRYKLEGFGNDWIEVGSDRRFVTYTNLSPGAYVFRVIGSNNDGVWNQTGTSLKISLTPPWWRTWWFHVSGLMVLAVAAVSIHKIRLRSIKKRNRQLQEEVDQRKQAEAKLRNAVAEVTQLKERLEGENVYLRHEVKLEETFSEITGQSEVLKSVLHRLKQVVSTDATVLLLGETGTGKELFANAIHNHSARKGNVMIKVNCASLPAALIESELFGREKGAYTGALSRQAGRFEIAHGSTIFLDEIGELPLELQAKLLRVLQDGEFERLGSSKTTKVDVRVIAASNRDLAEEVRKGSFREDLYYRLNVFPIKVPSLRERAEDIPLLVWAFIDELGPKIGKKVQSVPKKSMEELQRYHWPGNIRQLRNIVEHALIISLGKTLQIQVPEKSSLSPGNGADTLAEIEFKHITEVLRRTNWRIKGQDGAAKLLGLKPGTLYSRMKKLGIPTHRERADLSLSELIPNESNDQSRDFRHRHVDDVGSGRGCGA